MPSRPLSGDVTDPVVVVDVILCVGEFVVLEVVVVVQGDVVLLVTEAIGKTVSEEGGGSVSTIL